MAHEYQEEMIECELQFLDGNTCMVKVHLENTVATLKEQIESEMRIPCYSQIISDARRTLQSQDQLRSVHSVQDPADCRLALNLTFLDVPSQCSPEEVQRAWEAFRMYSKDYGETVPRDGFIGVMRYSEIGISNTHLEELLVNREWLTFPDVLSIMAKWNEVSATLTPDEMIDDRYDLFACKNSCTPAEILEIETILKKVKARQRKPLRSSRSSKLKAVTKSCKASDGPIEHDVYVCRSPHRDVSEGSKVSSHLISL
eukprot:TRINITY_DN22478_c0_g1_i1.p1 TRINITY_DN22478_c0_g1~~TRINITY_DN22478_c0_g1_i1.p1  ORF type:complete len:257 (-),score=31.26 TRINITY_DN22478_c0_g1_i1:109-879(-)